ncbi:hypothetical protein B0H14DRAFT_3470182 [Mycena olivaceomarginata]|nr:hypothetical protein B0H14DRAFT_3470182 [Mycena olivaceomarginata]
MVLDPRYPIPVRTAKPSLSKPHPCPFTGLMDNISRTSICRSTPPPSTGKKLYVEQYSKIWQKAEEFLDGTGGPGKDVLFFISCGMDTSEHEMETIQLSQSVIVLALHYHHLHARNTATPA